ncbi:MAG: 50S ribosomal protein L25, partial [Bacteroidota bacterium]
VTDKLNHIDFIELVDGQTVKCAIPLVLTGQSAGAKKGGVVLQKLRAVKVKTKPEFLVDEINLDISHLDLGQSARVREIEAIDGIEIMINPAVPVATIEIPRSLRSAASKQEVEG